MVKRIAAAALAVIFIISVLASCSEVALRQLEEKQTEVQEETTEITEGTSEPEQESAGAEVFDDEPKPEPIKAAKTSTVYTLTFAGDCTLGGIYEHRYSVGSFDDYLGDNYEYPFEYCQQYFENDDFTLVNLEGVLSTSHAAVKKKFRLIGSPEYAQILTAGNIDAVNLSNNHTYDFGTGGYADTKAALESVSMPYVEDAGTLLYTTKTGLVIGVYAAQFNVDESRMREGIQKLREDGAEIIIFSYHGGIELSYRAAYTQQYYCRGAIDAGADIVFGHHPHVLQPVEEYNGGIIYYSLGNFSFGGNGNPQDHDTAIIQQKIIRDEDGNVSLGKTILIPFCVSSTKGTNDYRPIPLEEGTEMYNRCMEKLTGNYKGPDLLPLDFGNEEEEEPEEPEDDGTQDIPPAEEGGSGDAPPAEDDNASDTPPPQEGGGEGETPPDNTDG